MCTRRFERFETSCASFQRYLLSVEYVGSAFRGWQATPPTPSVQRALSEALSDLGSSVVVGSSRTDAGVHALRNVCHVDLFSEKERPARSLRGCANHYFSRKGKQVQILSAQKVSEEIHARFCARERTYEYRIKHGADQASLFEKGRLWHIRAPLDLRAMQEAAREMKKCKNFDNWRASGCQASSPIRSLDELTIVEEHLQDGLLVSIRTRAKSFLYKQVRLMVATLVACGRQWITVDDVQCMVHDKSYKCRMPVQIAPPHGLYLVDVKYDFPIVNE